MIEAALIGLVSALGVSGLAALQKRLFASEEISPLWILALGVLAAAVAAWQAKRTPSDTGYEGLADLFYRIHAPSSPDRPGRWLVRAFVSSGLVLFGGVAGAEGPAIEAAYGFAAKIRNRSARWFENRRRTDVACAMASGIAAAFGAPLAGILFPVELGIGGRTLYSAVASLVGFLGAHYLAPAMPGRPMDLAGSFYLFGISDWKESLGVIGVGVFCGVVGAALSWFVRFSQVQLLQLFRGCGAHWLRILTAGAVICFTFVLYRGGFVPLPGLLEQVLHGQLGGSEVGLIAVSRALILALALSGFGMAGLFWPLAGLGGVLGWGVNDWFYHDLPGFAASAGLVGMAAMLSAVLGAPVASAVLVFEAARSPQILLPALVGAMVARGICRLLGGRKLIESGLESRGVRLGEGRSLSVLESLFVKDAMITDFDRIDEQEPISGLRDRIGGSRYPFFPVIRGQKACGNFAGVVTLDMIQDALLDAESRVELRGGNHPAILEMLEVKDLLYRYGVKLPTCRPEQRLSEISLLLDRYPYLPVLDLDQNLVGLLMGHEVRLCYDREVARRSLQLAASRA